MKTAAAIFKRDIVRYFSSPTGYIFITLFILVSSLAQFWSQSFWKSGLANMDPLNEWFPLILVFFCAAVAMGTWADERRHGTDELLLTLPATELEIVLGKYFAALGIYAISLLFALSHVIVLSMLGKPDVGLMISSYFGYLLLGAAMLAIAMIGSFLSENVTIAFILGVLFCGALVGVEFLGALQPGFLDRPFWSSHRLALRGVLLGIGALGLLGRLGFGAERKHTAASTLLGLIFVGLAVTGVLLLASLDLVTPRLLAFAGVRSPLNDLTSGILSLRAVFYFLAVASVALVMNWFLLKRRRMTSGTWHLPVRAACLVAAAAGACVIMARLDARLDFTAERLHSLSDATRTVIKSIDKDHPVFIQAYVSPEVPKDYVETRETLLALLKEFGALGAGRIVVRVHETSKNTETAREAEDKYDIKPQKIANSDGGRSTRDEVYLGFVVTSAADEVVVPFLYKGLPVEYELTRSLRTVTKTERLKVGIMATDAKWMGGFNFDGGNFQQDPTWQIVDELKKQYEVVQVATPEAPIAEKVDVLVVPLASSLTQPQMDNLLAYIKLGKPVLLLDDPYPTTVRGGSPNEPKRAPGGMFGQQPPREAKGNITQFCRQLGVAWDTTEIVWDSWTPHSAIQVSREVVFVGAGAGAPDAINQLNPISSQIQEVVMILAGRVKDAGTPGFTFTPLLKAGAEHGVRPYFEVRSGPGGRYEPLTGARAAEKGAYALAARVTSSVEQGKVNLVFIADIDLVSDQFFELRKNPWEALEFDNVTLVLNAVDTLAGDDSVVQLRKRRPRHRTLEAIEAQMREHNKKLQTEAKQAEDDAKAEIAKAQESLDEKVKALRARTDLEDETKDKMIEQLEEVENRRLAVKRNTIGDEKERRIARSEAARDQAVTAIRNYVKLLAILLPPLPALFIGLILLFRSIVRELSEVRK